MINCTPQAADRAWVNDSIEAMRQPYNPTYDPLRDIDMRHILESLPDDSREFLEEYIDSVHSSDAAAQLKRALERITGTSGLSAATLEAVGIRVITLLWSLQSQKWDLCGMSLSEIGRKIGKTKADVSHWVKRNEEEFGIHARGQKMLESSKVYKASAKAGWSTRREKNPGKMSESERQTRLREEVKNQKKLQKQCN
jgi:hypothetical protein